MKFKVKETVRVKVKIWNRKGTVLYPGDFATVRSRYPHDSEVPTIVDLILPDGKLLINIANPEACLE